MLTHLNFPTRKKQGGEGILQNGQENSQPNGTILTTTAINNGNGNNSTTKWPIQGKNKEAEKKNPTWGSFMEMKKRKIFQQIHERIVPKTNIFSGLSFHINGHTVPPYLELRDMIVENGGEYHHYWTPKKTRYMVATNLATTKWKALGKNSPNFVVQPKWIVKSVKAGKRLPITPYLLIHTQKAIRDEHQLCAGASILTETDGPGTQVSIYDFTNIRRRQNLFENMYQEKMERKRRKKEGRLTDWEKEMMTLNAWNDLQKRRGKYACKKTPSPPPWKFDFGHVSGERHRIFIANLQIDYTKEARKEDVQRLAAMYKCKITDRDWHAPVKYSLNFMTRIFDGDEITKEEKETGFRVHPDWPIVLHLLKEWIQNKQEEGSTSMPSPCPAAKAMIIVEEREEAKLPGREKAVENNMKMIPAPVAGSVSKENQDNDVNEEGIEVTINEQEEEDGWNGDAESDWGEW